MCCKSQDLCTPGCISRSCCHRPTPLLSVPHLVAYQLNSWFHRQSCEAGLSCEPSFCSRLNHCSTDGIYNILSVRGTCLRASRLSPAFGDRVGTDARSGGLGSARNSKLSFYRTTPSSGELAVA